jgi:hypothetical protein
MRGGHYFCATFSFDFHDPAANRLYGGWCKNFSSEEEARQFSERELPVGKQVVVSFNPKNPAFNDLELDSLTCSGDRPTSPSIWWEREANAEMNGTKRHKLIASSPRIVHLG